MPSHDDSYIEANQFTTDDLKALLGGVVETSKVSASGEIVVKIARRATTIEMRIASSALVSLSEISHRRRSVSRCRSEEPKGEVLSSLSTPSSPPSSCSGSLVESSDSTGKENASSFERPDETGLVGDDLSAHVQENPNGPKSPTNKTESMIPTDSEASETYVCSLNRAAGVSSVDWRRLQYEHFGQWAKAHERAGDHFYDLSPATSACSIATNETGRASDDSPVNAHVSAHVNLLASSPSNNSKAINKVESTADNMANHKANHMANNKDMPDNTIDALGKLTPAQLENVLLLLQSLKESAAEKAASESFLPHRRDDNEDGSPPVKRTKSSHK